MNSTTQEQMDRWVQEQIFEEDIRAMVQWLRPHRYERMLGWKEMRSGGANFRVTVSWDPESERANRFDKLNVPHMADVLEAILIGSAKNQDDLDPAQECELYRNVAAELLRRIDEMQACYE